MPDSEWSDWLDFNQEIFKSIPETPGVFMMHQAMKILFIGGSENMKKSIMELATNECVKNTTRFKHKQEEDFEKITKESIDDFKKRHEGKLPGCMK